jgi:hypothetical protein
VVELDLGCEWMLWILFDWNFMGEVYWSQMIVNGTYEGLKNDNGQGSRNVYHNGSWLVTILIECLIISKCQFFEAIGGCSPFKKG